MTARRSRLVLAFVATLPALAAAEGTPALPKVISLNVCTDQLAMALAAPGQLLSVTNLASDPSLSAYAGKAGAWPANRGLAEEAAAAGADVIVTGDFSLHNTTILLRGLGYRVEEFPVAVTLDDIRSNIRRMGDILDRKPEAEALVSEFDTALSKAETQACRANPAPGLVVYGPNGVTEGGGTLPDSVIRAAGFRNLGGATGGLSYVGLEDLLAMKPDVVAIPATDPDHPALAQKLFGHRALRGSTVRLAEGLVDSALWTCGGPFTAEAVARFSALATSMPGCAAKAEKP